MKLVIVVLLLLAITIGFGIHTQREIQETAEDIRHVIPQIENSIRENNWQAGVERTEALLEELTKIQERWDLFTTHRHLDNIEKTLVRTQSYIKSQDRSAALAELAVLDSQLRRLHRNQALSLQNIF